MSIAKSGNDEESKWWQKGIIQGNAIQASNGPR
jgi:hypothetical protein